MKLFNNLHISNEAIDFQSTTFGKELEAVIESFKTDKVLTKDLQTCEQKKVMEAIVFKHTGLKFNIVLNNNAIACVYLPMINRNHIFLYNHFRNFYEHNDTIEIFKKIKEVKEKNTVNLKTAKVTGIFSEWSTEIHFSLPIFFSRGYTAGQMAAIFMHEVGHVFTLYELISRQHTTNQVLAGVMRSVTNKDSIKVRETVFEQAGEILGDNKNAFTDLVNQNDLRVITAVVFKESTEFAKSELGTEEYDYTTCEQQADQFVARQGYGRELIEGLDKLAIDYNYAEKNRKLSFIGGIIQVVTQAAFLTASVFMAVSGAPLMLLAAILPLLALFGSGSSKSDYTYDTLKTRYLRVREQMIDRLKDKNIDKEEIDLILGNLKKIDVIISDTHTNKVAINFIADFIFSKDKKVKESITLQRQLESLAMNDFFAKSAELSTI